ncbi:MAG: hypothetical protein ACREGA_03720 [Candidatus Saccharimonadales bacterium]
MPPQNPNQNGYNPNDPSAQPNPGQGFYAPPQNVGPQNPGQPNPMPNSGAPNSSQNQYDFFMDPQQAPKKSPLKLGGPNGLLKTNFKLVVGVGAAFVLLLLALPFLLGGGKQKITPAVVVLQNQQDLLTSSNNTAESAVSQPVKNLATNIDLVVATDQAQFLAYVAAGGVKLQSSTLDAGAATPSGVATANKLQNAVAASDYDKVYTQVAQQQLQNYAGALQTDYAKSKNSNERQMLQQYFKNLQALIKQAGGTPAQLPNT